MRLKLSLPLLALRSVCTAASGVVILLAACSEEETTREATQETSSFRNPIVAQRADPWAYRTEAGKIYFTATVPEFNRIELRSADSLQALGDAEPKVVWRKHWRGPMSAHIWAPELHRIDGSWYIYFAAGSADRPWDIRLYVLSNESADPMQGEWREEGRLYTAHDAYALDATTFEHKGKRYLIWAQKDPEDERHVSLYISAMASPTELAGPEVLIAEPEYSWEMQGVPSNLGPAALVKHGKVFVTYSGGATDQSSAIGLLWADSNADLLDAASWHKLPEPVFATNKFFNRYGPGHSSFTLTADGLSDVLLYHARSYRDLRGSALTDPNRHTRARVIRWSEEGFPVFGQSVLD